VETRPRGFDALTQPLRGGPLTDEAIRTLAATIERSVRPVHNTFLLPDYRRRMVSVYVRRALTDVRDGRAA
jgi:CO/xanthine dehydrogenase FAD-binding subunit